MIWLINPVTILLWVSAAWLIGFLGRKRRYGFFGNFLITMMFSPIVGIIVLLASDEQT